MKVLAEPPVRRVRCVPTPDSRCRGWSSARLEAAARHRVITTDLLIATLVVATALWILWRVA